MEYLNKWVIYSEHSGNHIVSLCTDGTYQCDCIGWTRHYPRINCKHIRQVIATHPEPLNRASWDALNGKKHKVMKAITKMSEANKIEQEQVA